MTTKLLDNRICTFEFLLSSKQRFWTIFLSDLLLAESSYYWVVCTPICIATRLLSASRCFFRSIRVRGHWNTPKYPQQVCREFRLRDVADDL